MKQLRRSEERGITRTSWLQSYHTFSFGDYYDPTHMGYRSLRVINDDYIGPGGGFPTHPHRNMEIITYVLSGALEHRDSMGNGEVIKAGELQRMSAGRGVQHSEFNHSKSESVHLLQIWIEPAERGVDPGYEQRPLILPPNELVCVVSGDGASGSMKINQSASLFLAKLTTGKVVRQSLDAEKFYWLHCATGSVHVGDDSLEYGDAVAINGEESLELVAAVDSQVLLFELI